MLVICPWLLGEVTYIPMWQNKRKDGGEWKGLWIWDCFEVSRTWKLFKPSRGKGLEEKQKELFLWSVLWTQLTLHWAYHHYGTTRTGGKLEQYLWLQPWSRWIFTEGSPIQVCQQKAEGSQSGSRTGPSNRTCLFCSLLHSHHPRLAGTQIFVGKCQVITIANIFWAHIRWLLMYLLEWKLRRELESCQQR